MKSCHLLGKSLLAATVVTAVAVGSEANAASFNGTPSPALNPTFGTLIDFDGFATGTSVGVNDYLAQGVTVTETSGAGNSFQYYGGTQSLPNYIGTGVGYEIGGANLGWDGTIRFDFTNAANMVGIGVANSSGGAETISAFDSGGMLLESYTVPNGANVYFGITRPTFDIARFEITGDFFAVDDLQFNPVPIPAALPLFATGLLGLIGIARRKKAA